MGKIDTLRKQRDVSISQGRRYYTLLLKLIRSLDKELDSTVMESACRRGLSAYKAFPREDPQLQIQMLVWLVDILKVQGKWIFPDLLEFEDVFFLATPSGSSHLTSQLVCDYLRSRSVHSKKSNLVSRLYATKTDTVTGIFRVIARIDWMVLEIQRKEYSHALGLGMTALAIIEDKYMGRWDLRAQVLSLLDDVRECMGITYTHEALDVVVVESRGDGSNLDETIFSTKTDAPPDARLDGRRLTTISRKLCGASFLTFPWNDMEAAMKDSLVTKEYKTEAHALQAVFQHVSGGRIPTPNEDEWNKWRRRVEVVARVQFPLERLNPSNVREYRVLSTIRRFYAILMCVMKRSDSAVMIQRVREMESGIRDAMRHL